MQKKITPIITNMVKNMMSTSQFTNISIDEVFQYIRSLQYLINMAAKDAIIDGIDIAQMLYDNAQELPVDKEFGVQIVFNAPLIAHAITNGHPIISIDNPDLINMLRDTDVTPELLQNVRLPFDEFIICFEYKGFMFEATAAKIILDESFMKVEGLSIASGDPFYSALGYMYRTGGKRPIVELYDMDVSSTNSTFNFFQDIPEQAKTIMLEAVKIFNGLFLYLSIPRTVEYIQGKRQVIRKATQLFSKTGQPAYLFNDVRYAYNKSDSQTTGIGKRSHLVRGHMRNQPFGKRENPEYKIVWIEPYFTTGDDKKSKEYKLN